MSELKRQCLIRELQDQGFYISRDGRVLEHCTLEQLEIERVRLPELEEVEA